MCMVMVTKQRLTDFFLAYGYGLLFSGLVSVLVCCLRSLRSLSLSLDPRFPVPRASLPIFFWLIRISQICALSANDRFFRTIMGLLGSIRDIHKTQI